MHTKEWRAEQTYGDQQGWTVLVDGPTPFDSVMLANGLTEPEAHLVASAPNQNQALTELTEQSETLLDLLDSHDVIKKVYKDAYLIRRCQLVDTIAKAHKAIRKAKGE